MDKTKRKRAITPIMATFLLATFAIAVAVTIMNLGSAQVEEAAECPLDLGLKLSTIGSKEQLCYDAVQKKLSFTVENGVNTNIDGLVVSLIGAEKADTYELSEAKITRAGSYVGKVSYDTIVSGALRQVKISPQVVLKEQVEICPDQAIVIESIGAC